MLKLHPAIFKEIYHERRVNNIYLDSFDLRYFFENINGISRRLKVRIRWYGELFGTIKDPVLELKLKHNLHVGKLSYPLIPFTMNNDLSINTMHEVFRKSSINEHLRLHLKELHFSLLNSYQRKYFLSADRKYRATVDSNIQVYKLSPYYNNFLYKSEKYSNTIIELKYNEPNDMFIDEITNHFSFRMTKNSKYINGIISLHR